MTLECPKCSARYNIQDSLIPTQGARVKCKKCSTVITIPAPVVELAPQDLELIPPPSPPTPPRPVAPPSPPIPTPPAISSPAPAESDSFEGGLGDGGPEPKPRGGFGLEEESRPQEPPTLSPPDSGFERSAAPARFGSPPSFAESASAPSREHAAVDLSLSGFSPAVAAEEKPVPPAAPEHAPRVAEPVGAVGPAAAESATSAPSGSPIPAGLSQEEQSKHEKARRLARVLASDIAIYNRDKRDRGIREGNLVAMLGYEIKKSWEIYKERVGSEFANSTPYFRDALNEMLAEGKKIF